MRTRNGFVSNSSTSSFIIVGVRIRDDIFKKYIYDYDNQINKDDIEDNFLKDFGISMINAHESSSKDEFDNSILKFWPGTCQNPEIGLVGLYIGDLDNGNNKEVTKTQIDAMYDYVNKNMKDLKQITNDTEAKLYGLTERC
jgi:hypothetical protein